MTIATEPEPASLGPAPAEHCAGCRVRTRTWTLLPDRKPGEQVALCDDCAARMEPDDVPTKAAWFAAERARYPR